MTELKLFLWWTFVLFSLVCLAFCIEAYIRYRPKRGIDDERGFASKYEYFGQPIYDHHGQLYGYELLLREFDPGAEKWRLPSDAVNFPLNRMVAAISEIDPYLTTTTQVVALNMTVSQLADFRAAYFFRWVRGRIGNRRLSIEVAATDICRSSHAQRRRMRSLLKLLDQLHIKVTIENVDSTWQTYIRLKPFLPYIDYLKFDAQAFNKTADHWIDVTLAQWQRRVRAYEIIPIVGKIEEPQQAQLVDQLKISLRQGYVYGQPNRVRLGERTMKK